MSAAAAAAPQHRVRNWSLMFLVNLLWAAQYPAYRVASESIGVAGLNVWSFAFATLLLTPFLLRQRKSARPERPRRSIWPIVLLAALGLVPPSVVLAWGIAHASASNGAILSLTVPVLMVAMGAMILHERPTRLFLVSLVLALAGTALISWNDIAGGSFDRSRLAGNVAIVLGSAGAAFYNAYGKLIMERFSELEVLVYGYLAAIVMCAAISLATEPQPFYDCGDWPLKAWLGVAVLGFLSWGLAMVTWMWLLNRLRLGQISVSVYMLPVLGVAISAITLGERLTLLQGVGGLVVLASAYFSAGDPVAAPAGDTLTQF